MFLIVAHHPVTLNGHHHHHHHDRLTELRLAVVVALFEMNLFETPFDNLVERSETDIGD